jgi:hypothetical protein
MLVTVELPDAIAPEAAHDVVEAVAFHAYAQKKISHGKLAEVLGISVWEAEERLATLGIVRPLTIGDVNSDISVLKRLP